jgi:hypothetical protein
MRKPGRSSLRLLWFAACVALALAAGGCGGSAGKPRTTASQSLPGINTSLPPNTERGTITTSTIPPGQRLRGDGDADNPGDTDGNGDIDPEDDDSDYPVPESYRFPDADDRATFAYGHAPDAAVQSTIIETVKRYYAAAAADEGEAACRMLPAAIAGSVAESYGQGGPSYLHGAKTCGAVLTLLFRHAHEELMEAVDIVEVRVDHAEAQVVLSSRKMRASSIFLIRYRNAWKVRELLGQPLP